MDPSDFRRHGHALVDWIAEYLAGVGAVSRSAPRRARRRPPRAARGGPRTWRVVRGHLRRLRAGTRAGADPLEPSRVFRLLRDYRQRARHPGRIPVRGAESAGHALAHVARRDRARGGRARLASRAHGPARIVRRRHLRHRLDLDASRACGRARSGDSRRARRGADGAPRPASASTARNRRIRPSTRP